MLNKKLVLGSLAAGSFLLPLVANAGVVTGPCVNCHTMHASQDGTLSTANAQLLVGTGCQSCHDYTTNDTDGLATGTGVPAPQVGSEATNPIAGGSFYSGGNDAQQHNVPLSSNAATDSTLGNTPPGGVLMAALNCGACHGGTGGHHGSLSKTDARTGGSSTNTYRQLYSPSNVGVAHAGGHANYNVNDSGATYGAAGYLTGSGNNINAFCGSCHSQFHTFAIGFQTADGTAGTPWIRHPTDWSLTEAGGSYSSNYTTNVTGTQLIALPVGSNGTETDDILCVTCHRPHGSPYPDLLRFNYDQNVAGGATVTFGCESCHGAK